MPTAAATEAGITREITGFKGVPVAVNVADNAHGLATSSLAASVIMARKGIEPVYQIVTRDRNRIAIQSDLLGAAALGINNVLCISGYHQSLIGSVESANVYDIDSIQLLAALDDMNTNGKLIDGTEISGNFSMLAGAVINPYTQPLELNLIRLTKKIEAGAKFIQTQAVFDTEIFAHWLQAAKTEGLTEKTAILAGVQLLENADEARELNSTFTDFTIPNEIINRLDAATDARQEGIAVCIEIINKIKDLPGLRGIHLFSGGKESQVAELLQAAGL